MEPNTNKYLIDLILGKVNETRNLIRTKWGVGRLVQECERPPLVLPFVHRGMEEVLPLYHTFPKLNKKLASFRHLQFFLDKVM